MKAATISMTCGHTATYGSPYPVSGELGWCHRCEEFRMVSRIKQINLDQDNVEDGYSKTGEITHCYRDEPRWFY